MNNQDLIEVERAHLQRSLRKAELLVDIGSALVELHAHSAFQRYRATLVAAKDEAVQALIEDPSSDLRKIGEQQGFAKAMKWFSADTAAVQRKLEHDRGEVLRLTGKLANIDRPLVDQLQDSFARPRSSQ